MRLVTACVFAIAACGDNIVPPGPDLVAANDLVVVAHQDDDVLFFEHDLHELVAAHKAVTIVYVTAGDGGNGQAYSELRDSALRAAYGNIAGMTDWDCGSIDINSHSAVHCRLPDARLSLIFLNYPDGGLAGTTSDSLLNLWMGNVAYGTTLADKPTTYAQQQLIDTVGAIIATTSPRTIRTLEIASTHGYDHSDHQIVGSLTMLAALQLGSEARLISYRGYNINYENATETDDDLYTRDSTAMRLYQGCMLGCGVCGVDSCPSLGFAGYDEFLHRRYAIGARQPPLAGILHTSAGCLIVGDNDQISIGDCASASRLELRRHGLVHVGGRCLEVEPDQTVQLGPCDPDRSRAFMFDDEGHLWSGVPPPPAAVTPTNHNLCVIDATDQLQVAVCGSDRDVRWDLMSVPVVTMHATTAATTTGRAIRLGDLTGDGRADLCTASKLGLYCAAGDGTGRFGHEEVVIGPAFAIEPQSLVLGDIDGDGLDDACGRDANGILCARAATGFQIERWSKMFASNGPATSVDQSLAIRDGALCGATANGVICVGPGSETPLSTWPAANAPVWPGDLDGDGLPDWCTANSSGIACGLASQRKISEAGVVWGYSLNGLAEGSVAVDGTLDNTNIAALGDISGDGRDDMCVALHDTVECAVSQGHGFGPRRLAIALPVGSSIAGMWLGDLDGDGRADPCVDDGVRITCALSP